MFEQEIAHKLDTSTDAIRMIRMSDAVGRAVVAGLAARLGLDAATPLGAQLVARGILSREAGAWLDGTPPHIDR